LLDESDQGVESFLYQRYATKKDKKVLFPSKGALVGQSCQCLLSKNFSLESWRSKSKQKPLNAVAGTGDTSQERLPT